MKKRAHEEIRAYLLERGTGSTVATIAEDLDRPTAQARALRAMGVPYRTRPDGTLLVGRTAADRALTGPAPAAPTQQAAANGLRWSRTA